MQRVKKRRLWLIPLSLFCALYLSGAVLFLTSAPGRNLIDYEKDGLVITVSSTLRGITHDDSYLVPLANAYESLNNYKMEKKCLDQLFASAQYNQVVKRMNVDNCIQSYLDFCPIGKPDIGFYLQHRYEFRDGSIRVKVIYELTYQSVNATFALDELDDVLQRATDQKTLFLANTVKMQLYHELGMQEEEAKAFEKCKEIYKQVSGKDDFHWAFGPDDSLPTTTAKP